MSNRPYKNPKDKVIGFAGLSSMISDLDALLVDDGRPCPAARPGSGSQSVNSPPTPVPEAAQPQTKTQQQPPTQVWTGYQVPAQPTGGGSGGKWLIGMAVFFGLTWLVSLSDKKPSGTSPLYASSTSSSLTTASPPVRQEPAAPVQAPSLPTEETPPVGTGNVLTAPQISYCKAQNIRLDAAKNVVNQYSELDINRFDALIEDYNSRCSNFRYRKGAMESAHSMVERFRSDYLAQGRQLFAPSNVRPRVLSPVKSAQRQSQPRSGARFPAPNGGAVQLSGPEEKSVDSACLSDKYLNGPAAYRSCRERQIAQLHNGPRRHDLSGLALSSTSSSSTTASSPVRQAPAAPVQDRSRPTEEVPPVGNRNILTAPQIRYCKAQNNRLDAARNVVNQYNELDINRLNSLVEDYNSRCSNFRYRPRSD